MCEICRYKCAYSPPPARLWKTGGVMHASHHFSASATFGVVAKVQKGTMTVIANTAKYVMNFEFLFRHKIESGKSPVAPLAPIFPRLQLLSFKSFTILLLLSRELKTHTVFTQNDLNVQVLQGRTYKVSANQCTPPHPLLHQLAYVVIN